jgi:hypothetical protein
LRSSLWRVVATLAGGVVTAVTAVGELWMAAVLGGLCRPV